MAEAHVCDFPGVADLGTPTDDVLRLTRRQLRRCDDYIDPTVAGHLFEKLLRRWR